MFDRMKFNKKLRKASSPAELLDIAASDATDAWCWEEIAKHPSADATVLERIAKDAPVDVLGRVLVHEKADEAAKELAKKRIDEAARQKAEEDASDARSSEDYDDCGCNSPGYGCTHR